MEDVKSYEKNLEKRFRCPTGFWSSILAFFTQSSSYDEAIEAIRKKDLKEAFNSDAKALSSDFKNAFAKKHCS